MTTSPNADEAPIVPLPQPGVVPTAAPKSDTEGPPEEKKTSPSAINEWTRRNLVKVLLYTGGAAVVGGVVGGGYLAFRGRGGRELTERERTINTVGYTPDDLAVMAAYHLEPEQCASAGVKGGGVKRAITILNAPYGTSPFAGLTPDQKTERLREAAVTLIQEEITTKESIFGKSFSERWARPIALNGALRGIHAIFENLIQKYGKKELSPEETARKNKIGKLLEVERGEQALAARSGDVKQMRVFLDSIEQLEAQYLTLEKKAKEGAPLPTFLKYEKEIAPIIQWATEVLLLISDINTFISNRPTGGEMFIGWPYALGRIVDHYASIRLFLPGGEAFKDLPSSAKKGAMYGLVAAIIIIAGQKLGVEKLLPNWGSVQPPSAGAPAHPNTGGGNGAAAPAPQPEISAKPPVEAPMTPEQKQKMYDDFRKDLGLPK